MAEYISNIYLIKNGKTIARPGETVDLSDKEAEAYGSRVVAAEIAIPNKPLQDLKLKELYTLAKRAGVPSYSTLNKGELVAVLSDVKAPEPVVIEDEQSDD